MASGKAIDAVYRVEPPSAAKKLRELHYTAHIAHSHIAHFYALAAPDFVVGPTSPPAQRNILGLINKVGKEAGLKVIDARAKAQRVQEIIGGRATHPVCNIPGGVSKRPSAEERDEIRNISDGLVEFAEWSLALFDDVVLKNKTYVDVILSDGYTIKTKYMGLVDENDRLNFYDGKIRVVDENGKEILKFAPSEYLEHIAEHTEPWSFIKFPHLKKFGWKGLVLGEDSGIYRVAPLGRLNASDGLATPKAQEHYERFYETLGGRPVHHTLATHWARLIELLYAAERMVELANDDEIATGEIRTVPSETPSEGVGVVEAPRGTLLHHYKTDENGIVTGVNLIVATVNNNAAICLSVKKAAQTLIHKGEVSEGLLNQVEMAFRAYDPCYACSSHSLPGRTPLVVNIRDRDGNIVRQFNRDVDGAAGLSGL